MQAMRIGQSLKLHASGVTMLMVRWLLVEPGPGFQAWEHHSRQIRS